MISAHYSVLLIAATTALALEGHADAAPCDADNYSKIASAVQTLHANCASWAAYLASGGVWTCDSTCHDAVTNLVNTLPECTFGGPYGQNYKDVVEDMVATCGGQSSSNSDSTLAPSSTTATPSTSTATPSSTTAGNNNSTQAATTTDAPTATTGNPSTTVNNIRSDNTADESTSASASAGDAASDVSTTSGADSARAVTRSPRWCGLWQARCCSESLLRQY